MTFFFSDRKNSLVPRSYKRFDESIKISNSSGALRGMNEFSSAFFSAHT
jgi:hypothetical protein